MSTRVRRPRAEAVPDEDLVDRARAGDAEAYGELVWRHRRAALRVAAAVLGTARGAEAPDDVVQAASERAWRAIDRMEAARAFRPWFLTIVANAARNDRRARGRRARLVERVAGTTAPAGAEGGATPEEAAVRREEHGEVAQAFRRLAEGDRVVLALRHVERMSEREMAAALDCPPGTVKSRLSRATVRLRAELVAVMAVVAIGALALAVGLVGPVREAVADLLGLGSTRIEGTPAPAEPNGRPAVGEGLVPATPAEAEEALGAAPSDLGLGTSVLGEPGLVARAPEGGVILAWADASTTLWVRRTGSAGQPIGAFVKRPTGAAGLRVEAVPALGEEALVVEGSHVLETPGRALAATTAVLWLEGAWEFRLEGTASAERLVAIARSFGEG